METLAAFYFECVTFFDMPLFGATRGAYLLAFTTGAFFFLLRAWFTTLFLGAINKILKKVYGDWEGKYSDPIRKPLEWVFILIGLGLGTQLIPSELTHSVTLLLIYRLWFILLVAYTLMRLEGFFSFVFKGLENRMNVGRSLLLQQFSLRIYRFVLVVITISVVLSQIGIDVGALVAGLGIAGLAFALAAQDTLSNVFAGITMIIDKPFDVGDRILTQGIDGIVEDINFRSTRIRTLEQEFVTLPNSKIAGDAIVNYTRRDMRKYQFRLVFHLSTKVEQLNAFMDALEIYLKATEFVDDASIMVKFKGFDPSGLDILVHYLTKDAEWGVFLTVNQDVHFKTLELIESHGLVLAYPSTSIYFENPLKTKGKKD